MATDQELVVIKGGPAKHVLLDALGYAYDRLNPFIVEFNAKDRGKVKLQITSLGHEDGSGVSFLFEGYVKSLMFELEDGGNSHMHRDDNRRVHGWYNTNNQQGWLKLGYPPLHS